MECEGCSCAILSRHPLACWCSIHTNIIVYNLHFCKRVLLNTAVLVRLRHENIAYHATC